MKKHNKNKYKDKSQDTQDKKAVDSGKENRGKDQPDPNPFGEENITKEKTTEASDVKQEIKKEQAILKGYAASESVSLPQDSFKDKHKENTPLGAEKDKAKESEKDTQGDKNKNVLPSQKDESIYPTGFHLKKNDVSPASYNASKTKTTSTESAEDKSKEHEKDKQGDKEKDVLPSQKDKPIYPAGFYKQSAKAAIESAEDKNITKPKKTVTVKTKSGRSSVFIKVILFFIFIGLTGSIVFLLFANSQHDELYKKAILDLNSQITELSSNQSKLLKTIDSQDQKIAAQEVKLASQVQKIEKFQNRADQMAGISGKVSSFDEQISAFDEKISSYDYKIKAVSRSVFRASNAIASLKEKVVNLETADSAAPESSEVVEVPETGEAIEETSGETASISEEAVVIEKPVEKTEKVVDDTPEEVEKPVDKIVPSQDAKEEFLYFMESIVEKIGKAGIWIYETSKKHF